MPDDAKARKLRAKHLREQIERLVAPGNAPKEDVPENEPANESPREFVHRKMRERGKGEPSR